MCVIQIMLRHYFYDCREGNMEPFDGLDAAPGSMLQPMQLSLTIEVSASFHGVDSKKRKKKEKQQIKR